MGSLKAAQNTPEALARSAAVMNALHQDPEFIARRQIRLADPEMIQRRNASISAAHQIRSAAIKAAKPIISEDEKGAIKAANYQKQWTLERRAAQAETNNMRQGVTREVELRRAETLRATHTKRKAEKAPAAAGRALAMLISQQEQFVAWLEQNCELGEGFLQLRHELFSDYANFTTEPMKQTEFYLHLESLGFILKKSSSRFYIGLKLAATTSAPYTESS
jgi:hypothetical protein